MASKNTRTDTSIRVADQDVAEMFRRRRDEREMTNAEYLEFLLKEATVHRNREELIKQTQQLNERLRGGDNARDGS